MDGEILSVWEDPLLIAKPSFATYNVRVTMDNGVITTLRNVPVASMFGGIGDSLNIVARTAKMAGPEFDGSKPPLSQMNASVGDRVVVAMLGGHFKRAIIVGYLQHPSQLPKYSLRSTLKPQASLDYLGMTFNVDELGQLSIIHRGSPVVEYVEQNSLSGSLGTSPTENPALTPADKSVITKLEFLDEGGLRLRDSSGNGVWLDPVNQTITLSDVGMPSTDDELPQTPIDMTLPSQASRIQEKVYLPNLGESIVIDKANTSIDIYSSGTYTKTIQGDVTNKILGNKSDDVVGSSELTISGDQTITVRGGVTTSCYGDLAEEIFGSFKSSVTGDLALIGSGKVSFSAIGDFSVDAKGKATITAMQDLTLSASAGLATLKLAQGGKFEITGSTGGLVDLILKLIDAVTQLTVGTGTGPSSPPINAAQFVQIKTMLAAMKA